MLSFDAGSIFLGVVVPVDISSLSPSESENSSSAVNKIFHNSILYPTAVAYTSISIDKLELKVRF